LGARASLREPGSPCVTGEPGSLLSVIMLSSSPSIFSWFPVAASVSGRTLWYAIEMLVMSNDICDDKNCAAELNGSAGGSAAGNRGSAATMISGKTVKLGRQQSPIDCQVRASPTAEVC
jgi:hypothetical protein